MGATQGKGIVIPNVRLRSEAGWYLGSIYCDGQDMHFNDRDTFYYPTEEWLLSDYPQSISMEQALAKGVARGKLSKTYLKGGI